MIIVWFQVMVGGRGGGGGRSVVGRVRKSQNEYINAYIAISFMDLPVIIV